MLTARSFSFAQNIAPAPEVVWVKGAGGFDWDEAGGCAPDSEGNVFVTGSCRGVASFGEVDLNLTPSRDTAFLAKYSSTGDLLWVRAPGTNFGFGYGYESKGIAVAIHQSGFVYLLGEFHEPVVAPQTGGTNFPGSIFLAKFDPAGVPIWYRRTVGDFNGYVYPAAVAVDASGNCYIAGSFGGTRISFAETNLYGRGNDWDDVFLAKYSSNGDFRWVVQAGGPDFDKGYAVNVRQNGDIWLAGRLGYRSYFQNATNLTGTNFIAQLDENGSLRSLWNTKYSAQGGLAIDLAGNFYLQGLESPPLRVTLAKLAVSGGLVWSREVMSPDESGYVLPRGIAVDSGGNIWANVEYQGNMLSFAGTNVSRPVRSLYLGRLNPAGSCEVIEVVQGGIAGAVSTDSHGAIYWAGSFITDVSALGRFSVTNHSIPQNNSQPDLLISKLSSQKPKLSISTSLSMISLTWPAWATSFSLYGAEEISAGSWTPVQVATFMNEDKIQASLPPTNSSAFFRLLPAGSAESTFDGAIREFFNHLGHEDAQRR